MKSCRLPQTRWCIFIFIFPFVRIAHKKTVLNSLNTLTIIFDTFLRCHSFKPHSCILLIWTEVQTEQLTNTNQVVSVLSLDSLLDFVDMYLPRCVISSNPASDKECCFTNVSSHIYAMYMHTFLHNTPHSCDDYVIRSFYTTKHVNPLKTKINLNYT